MRADYILDLEVHMRLQAHRHLVCELHPRVSFEDSAGLAAHSPYQLGLLPCPQQQSAVPGFPFKKNRRYRVFFSGCPGNWTVSLKYMTIIGLHIIYFN